MNPCFLIFGFGYTARSLAQRLVAQGFKVIGTTRDPHHKKSESVELIDFNCSNMNDYLAQSTHILMTIPPNKESGDLVLERYGGLIKHQSSHLKWLGYLSSTGVYGDYLGAWVDENSVCKPYTPTGMARLNAEQGWMMYAKKHQLPLHVFRLSGIYGPKRNALERLLDGKKNSIFKEGHVFCRIHVDDIISTLLASIASCNPLSIYNISDDEPTAAYIVDKYAASLLRQEPPVLISFDRATLSVMEQEFYSNNRRVSNLKIKNELNVDLKYPTYKMGLSDIFSHLVLRN